MVPGTEILRLTVTWFLLPTQSLLRLFRVSDRGKGIARERYKFDQQCNNVLYKIKKVIYHLFSNRLQYLLASSRPKKAKFSHPLASNIPETISIKRKVGSLKR